MTNAKHTQGPWLIRHATVLADMGNYCDTVAHMETVLTNWEANARLIAAAPELLDILYKIRNALASWDGGDPSGYKNELSPYASSQEEMRLFCGALSESAGVAIAKATGAA